MELESYLNKSNEELLHLFKWGSNGENEFNSFINLIKLEVMKNVPCKSSNKK
jgi:hypothetical protein